MKLLDRVYKSTQEYIEQMSKEQRKKIRTVFYKQGNSRFYVRLVCYT